MTDRGRIVWTFVVTSAALFMASLDNLVVTTALPSIRDHLHASLAGLQWTVKRLHPHLRRAAADRGHAR